MSILEDKVVQVGPTEAELEQQRAARLDQLSAGAADETFGEDPPETDADPADLLEPGELEAAVLTEQAAETDPETEPEPESAPVEEPGQKPDPLEAVNRLADRLAEKLQPAKEAPKPEPSKRENLRAALAERLKPESLSAELKQAGVADTPQNRKALHEQLIGDAQRIDAMLVADEATAEARAAREEVRELKFQNATAPLFEKAGVATLPARAQALVQHYTREYMTIGKSAAEALEAALAETGYGEVLAERKTKTAPAASAQRRASPRAISAQAVAGRAQPTATAPKRQPASTEEERQRNILRIAKTGW